MKNRFILKTMKRIHVFTFHQWYLILNPDIDYLDLNWWIVPALGPMYQYQHVSIKWYICIIVVVIRLSLSQALFQISGGPWIFLCDIVINKWTVPSCCTDRCCWSSRINHRWEFSHGCCETARAGCFTFRCITWCESRDQIHNDLCCLYSETSAAGGPLTKQHLVFLMAVLSNRWCYIDYHQWGAGCRVRAPGAWWRFRSVWSV